MIMVHGGSLIMTGGSEAKKLSYLLGFTIYKNTKAVLSEQPL